MYNYNHLVANSRVTGSGRRPNNQAPAGNVANVAGMIRKGLLVGDYAPGQRLVEADLCEQLQCSRFIARMALQVLATEGLVEIQRNRGARVRAVPVEEAIEITEVRMALEGFAAARAAERVTARDVAKLREILKLMQEAVKSLELLTYSDLNARLHSKIRAIAGNQTCTRTIEQLMGQIVRHQFALSLKPGRASVSLVQHKEIVRTIAAGDTLGAERAMKDHLSSVIEELRSRPAVPRL